MHLEENIMLKLEEVTKKYKDRTIINKLSFEINDNESVSIIGRSGCGKTTLLRIISGFECEYDGKIYIDNIEMGDKVLPRQRNISIVNQDPTLWDHMNIYKNITFGMSKKDDSKVREVTSALKIDDLLRRYPKEISGGQAKRIALARALLSDKKYLLLDEPLANVDYETKKKIIDFLLKHYVSKQTIIYVTHDMDEIELLGFKTIKL